MHQTYKLDCLAQSLLACLAIATNEEDSNKDFIVKLLLTFYY